MTPEEALRVRLEEMGVSLDSWRETEAGSRTSPILERQKAALIQVKHLLEQQLGADKTKITELQETLNRLQHGGGS